MIKRPKKYQEHFFAIGPPQDDIGNDGDVATVWPKHCPQCEHGFGEPKMFFKNQGQWGEIAPRLSMSEHQYITL